MMSLHREIVAWRAQARDQMILALTPQHRARFADIVARLVVDPRPNAVAAVKQIDALLSADERLAIVTAAADERIAEQSALRFGRTRCGDPRTPAELRGATLDQDLATDAGAELLRTVLLSVGGNSGREPRR